MYNLAATRLTAQLVIPSLPVSSRLLLSPVPLLRLLIPRLLLRHIPRHLRLHLPAAVPSRETRLLRLLEPGLLWLLEPGVLGLLVLWLELGHDVVLSRGVFVRAVEGAAELGGLEGGGVF